MGPIWFNIDWIEALLNKLLFRPIIVLLYKAVLEEKHYRQLTAQCDKISNVIEKWTARGNKKKSQSL